MTYAGVDDDGVSRLGARFEVGGDGRDLGERGGTAALVEALPGGGLCRRWNCCGRRDARDALSGGDRRDGGQAGLLVVRGCCMSEMHAIDKG